MFFRTDQKYAQEKWRQQRTDSKWASYCIIHTWKYGVYWNIFHVFFFFDKRVKSGIIKRSFHEFYHKKSRQIFIVFLSIIKLFTAVRELEKDFRRRKSKRKANWKSADKGFLEAHGAWPLCVKFVTRQKQCCLLRVWLRDSWWYGFSVFQVCQIRC